MRVWTHLASWLVKSGEVAQMEVGDTFPGVAVRAACWSVVDATGSGHYEVVGNGDSYAPPAATSMAN